MGQQQTRRMVTSLTMPTAKTKLGKLRLKNQQSQGIHKSAEDPLGNKAHLIGQSHVTPENLEDPGYETSHQQIFHPQTWANTFTTGHKASH